MELLKNNFFKRIIVSLLIMILLVFFVMTPPTYASKLKMEDDEFYYAGTTKGSYVVTEGVFSWLLSKIGEITDFLLGLLTMIPRMVFIGWTAIFEKFMTFVLESTTGMPMDIDRINATSVEETTSSSDNVTVEAIVYNQVPVFNINFFKEQEEITRCVTGTGRFFIECEKCATGKVGSAKFCRMRTCNCETCKEVIEKTYATNMVSVVRKNVSGWYSVIRYVAIAAMLCLLLVIGIKMAISSVAQDKAMYKRMMVDWLAGFVLLFVIHYIMVACVYINESIVDIIKDAQTDVVEITKKDLNYNEKTEDELEISIYEAVRTRAYDAKLINGTTGMLMYMMLVFQAFRFCIIYFKRYLTMIALTLMAPGVAVAYAFQKAMTGKSKSFSKWLQEYFVNAFIQSIHALLYTSFVTTALVISLNSVSGMIFALVIMNFMTDADKIFRKIFKLTEGGSLAENTADKSDPKELMQNAQTAATFMMGAKALGETPVGKAIDRTIKAPLHLAETGAMRGAMILHESFVPKESEQRKINKQIARSDNLYNIADQLKYGRSKLHNNIEEEINKSTAKEFKNYMEKYDDEKEVISLEGEDAIEQELDALEQDAYLMMMESKNEDEKQRAREVYEAIVKEGGLRDQFEEETELTTGDVMRAHLAQILDKDNYFDMENGKRSKKTGKIVYDPIENKKVKKRMYELINEQMTIKNMLGLTEQDEKLFKETMNLYKTTLLGMGSMFVGLGTVVSNPLVGMGLLANGISSQYKYLDAMGYYDPNPTTLTLSRDTNRRFTFSRFGKGAKQNIVGVMKGQSENEHNRIVVENVKENHSTLYKAIKLGDVDVRITGSATNPFSGISNSTNVERSGPVVRFKERSRKSLVSRIEQNHFKQYKALRKSLAKDEVLMLSVDNEIEVKNKGEELFGSFYMKPTEEQIRQSQPEQQDIDIKAKNAAKTQDGEVISLSTTPIKDEQKIIDQATAEVIVSMASGIKITDAVINAEGTMSEIKKVIELKLQAQGILEKGIKLDDSAIKQLDTRIKTSASKVMNELEGNVPVSKNGEQEPGLVETVLMNEAMIEQVSGKKLDEIGLISAEDIAASVKAKKKMIMSKQSTVKVTEEMQKLKDQIALLDSSIANREAMIAGRGEQLSERRYDELLQMQNQRDNLQNQFTQAGDRTFEEKSKVSDQARQAIDSALIQIRQPVSVVSDPKRHEKQTKYQVDTLKTVLDSVARTGNTDGEVTINGQTESVDNVIKQLIANTDKQREVYELVEYVSYQRRLNQRGSNLKMKTADASYGKEKRQKDNKHSGANPEVYGPVTNIIELINNTQKEAEKTAKRNRI